MHLYRGPKNECWYRLVGRIRLVCFTNCVHMGVGKDPNNSILFQDSPKLYLLVPLTKLTRNMKRGRPLNGSITTYTLVRAWSNKGDIRRARPNDDNVYYTFYTEHISFNSYMDFHTCIFQLQLNEGSLNKSSWLIHFSEYYWSIPFDDKIDKGRVQKNHKSMVFC